MRRRTRILTGTLTATLLAASLALVGCTGAPSPDASDAAPRAVTSQEAELLAVMRFNNFDEGARSFTATLDDRGHPLTLTGRVDFTTHTGYATLLVDGADPRQVLWNDKIVAVGPSDGTPVGDVPTDLEGWNATALDVSAAPLHGVLAVLLKLGADRPDNPVLIEQGGALRLRGDTAGVTPVTVFTGPSKTAIVDGKVDPDAASVRYWVDKDGVMHRVELRLGSSWATMDLADTADAVPPVLDGVTAPEPAP